MPIQQSVDKMSIKSWVKKKFSSPFSFLKEEHFKYDLDRNEGIDLFKRSVTMVEIEIFSFCNRCCWFCPNTTIDRRSENVFMDEELYRAILSNLREVNYAGMISYSRYNEPLADKIILERIRLAAHMLPDATLHTNTNGDYLNQTYLEELYISGLRSLNIQIYFSDPSIGYSELQAENMAAVKIRKLGLSVKEVIRIPDERLEYNFDYKEMRVKLYARNFAVNGSSRGGLLDINSNYVRTSPCLSPFYHLYIDYNGCVMPCCNLRSDSKEHQNYIVTDLTRDNMDIFSAYTSKNLTSWRSSLIGFDNKTSPCDRCNFVTFPPTRANIRINKRFEQFQKAGRRDVPDDT